MSDIWVSIGSRTDLSAGSSSDVLHSIYGSQVSQLPIRSGYCLDESDDEQWTRATYSSPHLLRPKSAYATLATRPRQRILSDPPFCNAKLSHDGLVKSSLRKVSRPKSAYPSQTRSFRPKSALTTLPNMIKDTSSNSSRLKRPVTAHSQYSVDADISFSERRLSSAKLVDHTSPVVLSSTPQYFDFWNEKPLKPRDWTVKTYPSKQRRRPKSSYGTLSLAGSHNKRAGTDKFKGERDGKNGKDTQNTNENGLLSGSIGVAERDRNDMVNGNTEDRNNGTGIKSDDLRSDEGRSKNGTSLDKIDGTNNNSSLSGKENNSGIKDSQNMLKTDDHDASCRNNQMLRDVLGRDGPNDSELEDYFNKQRSKHSSPSDWLDVIGGSASKTRFNLPVDMKILEEMSPADYLQSYCLLSHQRNSHYSKVFSSLSKKPFLTSKNEVLQGLVDAHHKLLSKEQAESIVELMKLPTTKLLVDKKLFGGMCAVAERIFGVICLPFGFGQRDIIEVVDFEALDWKLQGCRISEDLLTLLVKICQQ